MLVMVTNDLCFELIGRLIDLSRECCAKVKFVFFFNGTLRLKLKGRGNSRARLLRLLKTVSTFAMGDVSVPVFVSPRTEI